MEINSTNASLKNDIQIEMMKKSQDVQEHLVTQILDNLDVNKNIEKKVAEETKKGINLNLNA